MSSVHSVSADGSVMVGNTAVDFKGEADSFRIVGSDIQPIGDLPGGAHLSGARAVSADGSVVVGRGVSANGPEGYRWENGIFTPLGDLSGGTFDSFPAEVSGNGQYVVGQSESSAGMEAFLWSAETGMVGLGHLPGETTDSRARGVSGDGSVVVGMANVVQGNPEQGDAFIWDAINGMRNLQSVLIAEYGLGDSLAGWTLHRALTISDDGLIIAGVGTNPSGLREGFIIDLNPAPTLSIDDVQIAEGDSGTTAFVFTVTRSGDTTGTSSVDFATADGTAIAGTDYVATSGTVQFLEDETSQTITVLVSGDVDIESAETFTVELSNPTDATIADGIGEGTIIDNDSPASSNDIYVWDIAFDSRLRGKGGAKHDERILVTIRRDSDADGVAEASDAVVAGANVTVEVRNSGGSLVGTLSGVTDAAGVFTSNYLTDLPDDTYTAEVVALSHATYVWNGDLNPTANDGDADLDGLPDQIHAIPHGAAATASSTESTALSTFTILATKDAETSNSDDPVVQVELIQAATLPIDDNTSTEIPNDDVLTDEEPAIDNEAIDDLFANFDELLLDDLLAV